MLDFKKRTIMKRAPIKLSIGGTLAIGDVVGISLHNFIDFGWFVEPGESGSLKYISFSTSRNVHKDYDTFLAEPNPKSWMKAKFENGLLYQNFRREYILSFNAHDNRAFKITNPEEFFKDSEIEKVYLQGKDTLNKVKFPAK